MNQTQKIISPNNPSDNQTYQTLDLFQNPLLVGDLGIDSVLESSYSIYTPVLRSDSPVNHLPEAGFERDLFFIL